MFIEVTEEEHGVKFIINVARIDLVVDDGIYRRISFKNGEDAWIIKESYEDIKTLLNAKWVAE